MDSKFFFGICKSTSVGRATARAKSPIFRRYLKETIRATADQRYKLTTSPTPHMFFEAHFMRYFHGKYIRRSEAALRRAQNRRFSDVFNENVSKYCRLTGQLGDLSGHT